MKEKFYETILFLSMMMHTVVISNLPYSVIFSFLIKCWSQPFITISLLTSRLQPTLCKSAVMSRIRVLWQHTHKKKNSSGERESPSRGWSLSTYQYESGRTRTKVLRCFNHFVLAIAVPIYTGQIPNSNRL